MNLKIVYKKTKSLIPYAKNSRTHSEAQIEEIAASIAEFDFIDPVSIDPEGVIITGHGSVLAAEKMGLEEVPCIELGHLSDRQKRAYIIAHNKIALKSGWDMEKLSQELSDLALNDFDISLIGFDEQELDELLKTDADFLPEDGETAQTEENAEPQTDGKTKKAKSKILHTCPNCGQQFHA